MTFEPDISDDCLLIDGTETVTLHSSVVVEVAGAKRGVLTLGEMEFRQIGVEASDLVWSLPMVNLAGVEPRHGDAIEDTNGAFWTVLSATRSSLCGVWRLICRKQL